jgi:hypothetical protein
MRTLTLLSALAALFTSAIALGEDNVRVVETRYSIEISGPESPCLKSARLKNWDNGLSAAVWIRNCLDNASFRRVAKK